MEKMDLQEKCRKFETVRERDAELERFWDEFSDVPMDPETECMEERFLDFPAGTNREDIWHWFDERYSKGVYYLMHRDGVDRTEDIAKLLYLSERCDYCDSSNCYFNHRGECRFPLVHERAPRIDDENGCIDYDYYEGYE